MLGVGTKVRVNENCSEECFVEALEGTIMIRDTILISVSEYLHSAPVSNGPNRQRWVLLVQR